MPIQDSGIRAVVARELSKRQQPALGHTFVGYRRKGFDEFMAIFKFPGNPHEQRHDKYTCEQVVKNATLGTETHEAAKKALQHWPSA